MYARSSFSADKFFCMTTYKGLPLLERRRHRQVSANRTSRKTSVKPTHYSARDTTPWAVVYLAEHSELTAQARLVVERLILAGELGKPAQTCA